VDQWLAEGVWNAVVIWRERQAKGYTGGVSILRDYIRPKRGLRAGRTTVRFETEPGRQLQSDWAVQRTIIDGRDTDAHFVVNTLGFSRRFHFWCTDTEDAEHTYEGIVRVAGRRPVVIMRRTVVGLTSRSVAASAMVSSAGRSILRSKAEI
jgi:transposase